MMRERRARAKEKRRTETNANRRRLRDLAVDDCRLLAHHALLFRNHFCFLFSSGAAFQCSFDERERCVFRIGTADKKKRTRTEGENAKRDGGIAIVFSFFFSVPFPFLNLSSYLDNLLSLSLKKKNTRGRLPRRRHGRPHQGLRRPLRDPRERRRRGRQRRRDGEADGGPPGRRPARAGPQLRGHDRRQRRDRDGVQQGARGAEDVYSTMVAAFGSGMAFSLVSGMGGTAAGTELPRPAPPAGTAAAAAGMPTLCRPPSPRAASSRSFRAPFTRSAASSAGETREGNGAGNLLFEGPEAYARANYMLQTLDLAKFEKNIKRAQLSDATLLLWTEASLAEAKVPPGPRLLILNHLDHYRKNMMKPGSLAPGQMPPAPPPPLEGGSDRGMEREGWEFPFSLSLDLVSLISFFYFYLKRV